VHFHAAFQLGWFGGRDKAIALAGDLDVGDRIVLAVDHGGAQPLQVAFVVGLRLHALAGLELHHAFRNLIFFDEVLGRFVIHAQAGQQGGQRVAGADFLFVDEMLGRLLFQRIDLRARSGATTASCTVFTGSRTRQARAALRRRHQKHILRETMQTR
jgi:hypothetical protein